jgi:hypothetical protein
MLTNTLPAVTLCLAIRPRSAQAAVKLRRLNGDHAMKIDGSFVRGLEADPEFATLVKSAIDMGHGLGLKVVAGHRHPCLIQRGRCHGHLELGDLLVGKIFKALRNSRPQCICHCWTVECFVQTMA